MDKIHKYAFFAFLISIFVLKSTIEDIIDKLFPNQTLRLIIGIIGLIIFGLIFFANGNLNKLWQQVKKFGF